MEKQESPREFLQIDMLQDEHDYRTMPVIAFELFFRHQMGERYFNLTAFKRGFLILFLVRVIFFTKEDFANGYLFHPLDAVLGLYLLLSFFHWVQVIILRNSKKEVHSLFIGYSRFFFLGNALMLPFRSSRAMIGYYFTYIIIEPLIALVVAALGYFYIHSIVITLFSVIVAALIFYNNYRKVNYSRQRYLDRKDSVIRGDMMRPRLKKMTGKNTQNHRSEPLETLVIPPKKASFAPSNKGNSAVDKAMKNLNPKLKNLGKKRPTKN